MICADSISEESVAPLVFEAVSKSFPGVQALEEVSFAAQAGSVHALMGENGAGKSTLLKILSGAQPPTSGALRVEGEIRVFRDTSDALAAGIAVIYQELHLVPEMSVAENIFLGHLPRKRGLMDRRALEEATRAQLARIGEAIDPWIKVGRLSIAQRQMVEIAKALSRGARLIAFDEPTSSLSDREVRRLFKIIGDLKSQGCAVLYVSHRMEEIFQLCDRVTVLRDGRHLETGALAAFTRDRLVQRMVGRELSDIFNYTPPVERGGMSKEEALQVEGLLGPGLRGACSFSMQAGEILGIFGLVGAGRSELLRLLAGAERKTGGTVRVEGREVSPRHPCEAISAGVVMCPEDRKKDGIVPMRSVMENTNLSARRRKAPRCAWGLISDSWERANATEKVKQLRVKTPSLRQAIRNLSGGNQQKVILGRWLSEAENLKVVLFDEPTRGIDVGAKSEIYAIMQRLAQSGVAVVVVSSELPEVIGVSDRVMVMRQGQVAAILPRSELTEEVLLKLALPEESGANPRV